MQARRASRELALILFSQFDKKITEYSDKDFEDLKLALQHIDGALI